MREIKFSYILQHEETGYMIELFFTMEEIEGSNFLVQLKEKFRRYNIVSRRQSTGLLDKNGKEIYEGDIVKIIRKELPAEIVTVINENCSFHFKSINNSMRINQPLYCWAVDYLGHFKSVEVEVIGNIYENPELLTK